MLEIFGWITENWMMMVGVAGTVVMGASIMVKAIAPLTKNTADDKAAAWLDKVYKWLNKLALNPAAPSK